MLFRSMITKEDSATAYEYEKHYIIYPHFSWWGEENIIAGGKKVAPGFEYNSGNNTEWLNCEDIRRAMRKVLI